jgi:hypothetical protein
MGDGRNEVGRITKLPPRGLHQAIEQAWIKAACKQDLSAHLKGSLGNDRLFQYDGKVGSRNIGAATRLHLVFNHEFTWFCILGKG